MPAVSGTVGTPWFHPGSPSRRREGLEAVNAGRRGGLLGSNAPGSVPGSEVVFAATAARGFQPVTPLSDGRPREPLLVLVNAFYALRLWWAVLDLNQ
jgi:hypothetical protein